VEKNARMTMVRWLVIGSLFTLAAAGAARAAEPEQPVVKNGNTFVFSAGKEVQVEVLINLMSKLLDKSFLYNQGEVGAKKVSLTREITATKKDAINVFDAILRMTQLAVVDHGLYAQVVPTANARFEPVPVITADELLEMKGAAHQVTVMIPLAHADPQQTARILTGMASTQEAKIDVLPGAATISATGPASSLLHIVEMAKDLDVLGQTATVKLHPLKNADATQLAQDLDAMLKARIRPSQAVKTQIQVKPYARLNALMVLASPSEHQDLGALIAQLDAEGVGPPSTLHVYEVKNRTAVDIAEVLEAFFSTGGTTGAGGAAGSPSMRALIQGSGGGSQFPFRIVADEKSNSLVVFSSQSDYEQLESILADLDRRRPQVLIEAALVEVSGSDSLSVGAELYWLDDVHNTRSLYRSAFGLASTGVANNTGVPDIPFSAINKGITMGYVKEPYQFTALLKAFAGRSDIRIIAKPLLLTADAEEAQFKSTDEQPVAERATSSATQDVVTTFGNYVEAGVDLKVKPYIRHAGYVRMEVEQIISDFAESSGAEGNLPPPRVTRQLKTVVDVPDNRIVVIGGIEKDRATKSLDRVPLLSKIPILGELFKNRDNTGNRNTVYLFLQPHILSDEGFADLAQETETRVKRLEDVNKGPLPGLNRDRIGPVEALTKEFSEPETNP